MITAHVNSALPASVHARVAREESIASTAHGDRRGLTVSTALEHVCEHHLCRVVRSGIALDSRLISIQLAGARHSAQSLNAAVHRDLRALSVLCG